MSLIGASANRSISQTAGTHKKKDLFRRRGRRRGVRSNFHFGLNFRTLWAHFPLIFGREERGSPLNIWMLKQTGMNVVGGCSLR